MHAVCGQRYARTCQYTSMLQPVSGRLVELAAALDAQMPALFSFAVLRTITCLCGVSCVRVLLPTRLCAVWVAVFDLLERVRALCLLLAGVFLMWTTASAPPRGLCVRYDATRVQGMCALLAMCVMLTSNRIMASGVALSALKAVAVFSTASVPLSLSAVVACINPWFELLYFTTLWTTMLTYAVFCHNEDNLERTHGAILAVLSVLLCYMSTVCLAVAVRVFSGCTVMLRVLVWPLGRAAKSARSWTRWCCPERRRRPVTATTDAAVTGTAAAAESGAARRRRRRRLAE